MLNPLFDQTGDHITDRDAAILWARTLLAKNPNEWVILDTETTGLEWQAARESFSMNFGKAKE